jgi:hypothetical protein
MNGLILFNPSILALGCQPFLVYVINTNRPSRLTLNRRKQKRTVKSHNVIFFFFFLFSFFF